MSAGGQLLLEKHVPDHLQGIRDMKVEFNVINFRALGNNITWACKGAGGVPSMSIGREDEGQRFTQPAGMCR
jgi:hypothetical protein